jgi:hypothetical protein
MNDADLNARVHAALGVTWDAARCPVCGWPLATDPHAASAGCMPGDCAQRPVPVVRADAPPNYAGSLDVAWACVDSAAEHWGASLIVGFATGGLLGLRVLGRYVATVERGRLIYDTQDLTAHSYDDHPARALCLAFLDGAARHAQWRDEEGA